MTVFNKEFCVVYVRVIRGCNLNCDHCFTLGNKDSFLNTDKEVIEKYLRSIKKNVDPDKITFYIHGGETFYASFEDLEHTNKLIRDIFKGKRFDIIPQTNLVYSIDERYIEFLKKEYNGVVGVSWDAGIRFNDIRQENLFFRNLKFLIENGISVNISITVQKYLLDRDPIELLKLFEGVDSIDFELLTIFDDSVKHLKVNNEKWSIWYDRIVEYYQNNHVSWSLPQVDLFVKSVSSGQIFDCKCNCCDKRTFTLNPDGTVGFCPDRTYVQPKFNLDTFINDWDEVESVAVETVVSKINDSVGSPLCFNCEHFDVCGGNCEADLFDETEECPLSRRSIQRIKDNLPLFTELYKERGKKKLVELRENYNE